jgi:DNA-directed RNA polymerase subunit RPC12/RpoP
MTVYEGLTFALITVLALAATAAIYLGLLNWMGRFHVVHCTACHHLTAATANQPQVSCPHCRHPLLLHPLHAATHPSARVRVLTDSLRY